MAGWKSCGSVLYSYGTETIGRGDLKHLCAAPGAGALLVALHERRPAAGRADARRPPDTARAAGDGHGHAC